MCFVFGMQAYEATDQLVILGTRAWFMDIRECFLNCDDIEKASQSPPTPLPEVGTQTAAVDCSPAPFSPTRPMSKVRATSPGANSRRPSLKALAQVSSAFSAAKVGTSKMSASLSAKGRSFGKATAITGDGAEKMDPSGQGGGGDAASGRGVAISGVTMSMPGLFKRASRMATEEQPLSGSSKSTPQQTSLLSPRGNNSSGVKDGHAWSGEDEAPGPGAVKVGVVMEEGGGTNSSKLPENEERERSHLFGGSSRSPITSPRSTKTKSPSASASRGSTKSGMPSQPNEWSRRGAGVSRTPESRDGAAGSPVANACSLPSATACSGDRREKRAFAGGLWNGSGNSGAAGVRGSPAQTVEHVSKDATVATTDEAVAVAVNSNESGTGGSQTGSAYSSPGLITKPKPSGGKRRFAGGGFSGPPQPAPAPPIAAPSGGVQTDNLFAVGSGVSDNGGDLGPRAGDGKAGTLRGSAFAAGETTLAPGEARTVAQSQDAAKPSVPAWASKNVPGWATESAGGGDKDTGGGGNAFPPSNGPGLAPPSRPEQGQQVAANNSPFMKVEPQAAPARRPSQTRPGEAGGPRRAFGGGERLF